MLDHFGILGFPWDGGASLGRPGARYAPEKIREAFQWFANRIENEKVYHVDTRTNYNVKSEQIRDYGDIKIIAYDEMKTLENAEKAADEIIKNKGFPFVLGGDHSISYPIIKALHDNSAGQIGIIHFDAHLDLVDGNEVQGKYSQSSPIRRALELERVNPENIVQIGVRGFNYPWYDEYLKSEGIKQYTAFEVHNSDPLDIANQVKDRLSHCDKIYLTFDIDVLDPAFAPGTGADEPFGLNPNQCMLMLNEFYPIVDAFDIAEVNPLYDIHNMTSALAARIMFECFIYKFSENR